jgi:hypothetical protein
MNWRLWHLLFDDSILNIKEELKAMTKQLDALTAAVAANTTASESAITLLTGLKTQLDAAIAASTDDDGDALQALSDSLGSESAKLAAAVTANTPDAIAAAASGVTKPPTPPSTSAPGAGSGS